MKKAKKYTAIFFISAYLIYLIMPSSSFPNPPADSLRSNEPADIEDNLRRSYFTNLDREQIIGHYEKEFNKTKFFGIGLPTLRLNYPPEDAQTIIRDQTRSVFLEELVHPMRESVYVNGYKASNQKDTIFINDKVWLHKITIRYIPSEAIIRFLIGIATISTIYLIGSDLLSSLKTLMLKIKDVKNWT